MTENKVVLVTGVAGYWGSGVAAKLVDEPGLHVVGLDANRPSRRIKGLDFVRADVRDPSLVERLKEVDTVCHLTFVERARPSEATFDVNVTGTMNVLKACAEAGVRKVVLKSSLAVYGAHPDNPAFLTEDHTLRGSRRYGYTRDMVEIETFCHSFRRQVPKMILTILRFASIVGPTADTPMTRFLAKPWTPVLLGFDPLMQVIHEDDVVGALVHAVVHDAPGAFNVAAEGVMPLTKLMGLAGKLPLPVFHPLAYWGTSLLGSTGLGITHYAPIEPDYLRYPWVGDLTRMRQELGFYPCHTAAEALREFAQRQRLRRYLPRSAPPAYVDERLRGAMERLRKAREEMTIPVEGSTEPSEVTGEGEAHE